MITDLHLMFSFLTKIGTNNKQKKSQTTEFNWTLLLTMDFSLMKITGKAGMVAVA